MASTRAAAAIGRELSGEVAGLVLVHRTESGWMVPEIVGRAVEPASWQRDRASVDDPAERRGHEIACTYHQRAFARAMSADVLLTSIRHELEQLHHLYTESHGLWIIDLDLNVNVNPTLDIDVGEPIAARRVRNRRRFSG